MINRPGIFAMAALFFLAISTASKGAEEIYLTDDREEPGKIFQILSEVPGRPDPFVWPKYFRESGGVHAVAFAGYGYAFFLDANRFDIYETNGVTEDRVFTHSTYVRDLDYDSRSRLYFSESSGSRADGIIYFLNPHTGRTTRAFNVPLDQVGGRWTGNFAFDPADRLFVSSGSTVPASIYEFEGGRFHRHFTHDEPIAGFDFVDDNTLYFTNDRQTLYELRDFEHLSVKQEYAGAESLSDVAIVNVPERGSCHLSGRVRGGEELWPITYVEAYGPNLVWRRSAGAALRVAGDGRYSFRNLPVGRYRIRTDIHGDTPVGFEPESHTVKLSKGGNKYRLHIPIRMAR